MKQLNITFTDDEYHQMKVEKDIAKKSWHDFVYERLTLNNSEEAELALMRQLMDKYANVLKAFGEEKPAGADIP